MSNDSECLCEKFNTIFGGTEFISLDACNSVGFRPVPITIEGINVFGNQLASAASIVFQESLDRQGKTLCLGEICFLEEEVTPFLKALIQLPSIKIASNIQNYMQTKPALFSLAFEAIECPLIFAEAVRRALIEAKISFAPSTVNSPTKKCKQIANILGTRFDAFCINGFCFTRFQRLRPSKILGRPNTGFKDLEFSFIPVTRDKDLCLSRLVLFPDEVNRIVKRIQKRRFLLGNVSTLFSFGRPPSKIVTYQAVANPFIFAEKTAKIIQGLR
ncbi:DUF1259 domain-containing protein [Chengkuizengella marina]|uniref:DUF1259 domain-containing protein n=1 Tax=Chengkuizengella marina TaxID=2507566 RepID=A0A6N9PWB6_9BACL|nr:DUF1259 domain-containing protein [Chengkuizengella marina]NBI27811.1 DUF1259 domain-containing protein [Chengkuizengella marina]